MLPWYSLIISVCIGESANGFSIRQEEGAERIEILKDYQIDDALVGKAKDGAIVMHCLPAYREKEITESVLEAHAEVIFTQAENRLHAQKAVLSLVGER